MKHISALQGLFIWVILCLVILVCVPKTASNVHQNSWWVLALTITSWWLYGYVN